MRNVLKKRTKSKRHSMNYLLKYIQFWQFRLTVLYYEWKLAQIRKEVEASKLRINRLWDNNYLCSVDTRRIIERELIDVEQKIKYEEKEIIRIQSFINQIKS